MSQDAKISKTNNISIIKFSTKYEIQKKKKAETPRDRPSAVEWQSGRESAESLERAHGSLKEVTWWGLTCQPDTKLEAGAGLVTGSIEEQ